MMRICLISLVGLAGASCAADSDKLDRIEQCTGIADALNSDGRREFRGFALLYDLGAVGKVVDVVPQDCKRCENNYGTFGFCAFHYGKFELNMLDASLTGQAQSNRIAHIPDRDQISRVYRVTGSAEIGVSSEGITLDSIEITSSEEATVDALPGNPR